MTIDIESNIFGKGYNILYIAIFLWVLKVQRMNVKISLLMDGFLILRHQWSEWVVVSVGICKNSYNIVVEAVCALHAIMIYLPIYNYYHLNSFLYYMHSYSWEIRLSKWNTFFFKSLLCKYYYGYATQALRLRRFGVEKKTRFCTKKRFRLI